MSETCEECGESTEWDQELGSAVCTHCGTLADPTQSVLTSHLEPTDTSGREYSSWNTVQGSTLKGRNGWALSGQSKEARDRNNTIEIHGFIRSVATRLGHPGVTSRAQGIFDRAMLKGQYRWGRKAKLASGAAIAVALRESNKSDSLRDIAYLLEEAPVSLSRSFMSLITLLNLNLTAADPSVHLPMLQSHLLSLIQGSSTVLQTLPVKLKTPLTSLVPHLPTVLGVATSLAALLSRTNTLSNVPTPPTACALAEALGARLGAGKGVVMQRYKVIYDLVEEWIKEVPWLDAHERKKGGVGRSKVAKRVVVARGLKDVVQFQEEIWKKRLQGEVRPKLELQISQDDEEGDVEDKENDAEFEAGTSAAPLHVSDKVDVNSSIPRKKRKTQHNRSIEQASQFLLNPLTSGTDAFSSSSAALVSSSSAHRADDGVDAPDLMTHLLTVDSSTLAHAFAKAPTRLQLLASSRGGTGEGNIADEELFAEGELEGIFRSAEEADIIRVTMGWDAEEGVDEPAQPARKRKRAHSDSDDEGAASMELNIGKARGSKRINMDALAKLLDPSTALGEDFEMYEKDDMTTFAFADGGEVVEEWRPLSPGGGGFDEERYDI
ncbi:predicted protein [Sparassis crispa]|uniref:TFIIB-type domain-containing protein n=1 Tax=Sparassis crispa TaxID=139825 RepID=A0A401GKB3_9APHY|nr:predicted protein [Sparassis crispa]GBE82611.1 predicted protein [Sparassis crispa]